MSKKFRKLLVPEGYRHYWSKYPEGYTILEALINWVDSVNQLTDNVNDWNIYLEDFVENFDEKLAPTVREMLNEMDQDGRLAEIINDEIFSWKADKTYVDNQFSQINTQINGIDSQLAQNTSSIYSANISKTLAKLKRGEVVNFLFIGDSTTEVNLTTNNQQNHVGMLIDELRLKYPNATINVENTALSGRSIQWANEQNVNRIINYNPDIVCICFGINDATIGGDFYVSPSDFEKYYSLVLGMISATLPNCEVIIRTPNVTGADFSHEKNERMVSDYVPIMKKMSIDYNTGYLDIFYYWKHLLDNDIYTQSELTVDDTHPTLLGHEIIKNQYLHLFNEAYFSTGGQSTEKKYYFTPNEKIISGNNNANFGFSSSESFYNSEAVHLTGDSSGLNEYTIPFYGDYIGMSYARASTGAIVECYVDGVLKATVDSGNSPGKDTIWNITEVIAEDLEKKWHFLTLKIVGRNAYNTTKYDFYLAGLLTSEFQNSESILEHFSTKNYRQENIVNNSTFEFGSFAWTLAGGATLNTSSTDSYVGNKYISFPTKDASLNQGFRFSNPLDYVTFIIPVYLEQEPYSMNLTVYQYDANTENQGGVSRTFILRQTGWNHVYIIVPIVNSTVRLLNATLKSNSSYSSRIGAFTCFGGLGERVINRDSNLKIVKGEDTANTASKNISKPVELSRIYSAQIYSKGSANVFLTSVAESQFTVESDEDGTGFYYEVKGI